MKNAWPVKAQAVGGRHYRYNYVDQNFDSYAVEYTFADSTKFLMDGRCMVGALPIYSSYAHGSKGLAIISKNGDCGTPSSTYKGQNTDRANMIWQSTDKSNPLSKRMGRTDLRHPRRQALQRSEARRGRQRRDRDGPHGRAHRRRKSPGTTCSIATQAFAPERGQIHHGQPAPGALRQRRQVSRAAARHRQKIRIRAAKERLKTSVTLSAWKLPAGKAFTPSRQRRFRTTKFKNPHIFSPLSRER